LPSYRVAMVPARRGLPADLLRRSPALAGRWTPRFAPPV